MNLLRISSPVTFILGLEFKPSLDLLEIDIAFSCNLKCYNCDRSCSQAPSNDYMSVNQIRKFISESLTTKKKWKRIRIIGGEPFLHPNIDEILKLLQSYIEENILLTRLEIVTNGFGSVVKNALKSVPSGIFVKNTNKIGKFQKKFEAFNLAPIDKKYHIFTDFSNACWITAYCGIGLNPFGYYICGVGGSIDRVMGKDIGLKELPKTRSLFQAQANIFCQLCGHFTHRNFRPIQERVPVKGEPKSHSWLKLYEQFKKQPPRLTRY